MQFMKIPHRRTILKITLVGLILLSGAGWLVSGSRADQHATPSMTRPALTVRTTMLREEKRSRTLTATGSILPWQEAIISAQVQGLRIAEVKVSIGDRVQQGDVLATLDNIVRSASEAE